MTYCIYIVLLSITFDLKVTATFKGMESELYFFSSPFHSGLFSSPEPKAQVSL